MKFGSKQNQKERKLDKGWLEQGMLREDGQSMGLWRWRWGCGLMGLVQMKREEESLEREEEEREK